MPFSWPSSTVSSISNSLNSTFSSTASGETQAPVKSRKISIDKQKVSLFDAASKWGGPSGDVKPMKALEYVKIVKTTTAIEYWKAALESDSPEVTLPVLTKILDTMFLEIKVNGCRKLLLTTDMGQVLMKKNHNGIKMYLNANVAGATASMEQHTGINDHLTLSVITALNGEEAARRFSVKKKNSGLLHMLDKIDEYRDALIKKYIDDPSDNIYFYDLNEIFHHNTDPKSVDDDRFSTDSLSLSSYKNFEDSDNGNYETIDNLTNLFRKKIGDANHPKEALDEREPIYAQVKKSRKWSAIKSPEETIPNGVCQYQMKSLTI